MSGWGKRAWIVVGLAAGGLLCLVYLLAEGPVPPPETAERNEQPAILKPTIGEERPPAPKSAARIEGSQPAATLERYTLKPPLLIYGAASFGPEGGTPTHLVGLDAPSANAVCKNDEGHLWACGLQARAALNNLIRTKPVTCMPETVTEAQVNARCDVEGRDLAQQLIERGFVRLAGGGSSEVQEQARRARLGLWNGSWTVR